MPKRYLPLIGLLAFIYTPTFVWMVDRWTAKDSYFGHGFLIPLISLYWVLKKRAELKTCERTCDPAGLVLLLAGAALQAFSSLFRVYFLSALSLVPILFGAVAFLFGKKFLKILWFPIAFLALMVPLPLLVISQTTLKMKFFVSEISTFLISATGIPAVREGSYIHTPHAVMLVGDPCSGLRSLLAFLCLGLVFAYESRANFWKKTLLVAAGLPLAILSNVVRVYVLGVLAEIYGMKFTIGAVHDASGIVVFVMAFFLFLILKRKLEESRVRVG